MAQYIFPPSIRAKLERIVDGSDLFIRDAAKGHPEGCYLSPKSHPRTRLCELYISAKGLTAYPSKQYLDIADNCISKTPVFHEKFSKQYEYFLSENEMYKLVKEIAAKG